MGSLCWPGKACVEDASAWRRLCCAGPAAEGPWLSAAPPAAMGPVFFCCEGQNSQWSHFRNLNILFGLNSVNSFFITCLKVMPMADEQLIFQKCHKRPNLKKKSNHYNCQAFPKRNGTSLPFPPTKLVPVSYGGSTVWHQSDSFKTSLEIPLWPFGHLSELQSRFSFTVSLCHASQRKSPIPCHPFLFVLLQLLKGT